MLFFFIYTILTSL